MKRNLKFSIIIPVGPDDQVSSSLIQQLSSLFVDDFEIIISSANSNSEPVEVGYRLDETVSIISSEPGRAKQLNVATAKAKGDFVWYVHADSDLSGLDFETFKAVANRKGDLILWYFALKFYGGPKLRMRINEFGVWFRCFFFKMPFGDQGFLIERRVVDALGGFSETASYGEDHLFVWQARKNGVQVLSTGKTLGTSARRYVTKGWGRLTLIYLWRTYAQAIPAGLGLHPAVKKVRF